MLLGQILTVWWTDTYAKGDKYLQRIFLELAQKADKTLIPLGQNL